MKKLILHLGGGLDRADKCIQLANVHPDAMILVSSEGGNILEYYTERGIDPNRVFLDNDAWDTVTNFTHTYRRIKKQFRPDKVIREDAIRAWIWRLTGILFYWKSVREARSDMGTPKKWNEIGL